MQVAQRMAAAVGDLPEGVMPELAPEATPLGEVYQFRVVSDRHDLYQLRAELQWNITRVLKAGAGRRRRGLLRRLSRRRSTCAPCPTRMRAHGVTLPEVAEALSQEPT